jgi:hypothetical protein
VVRIIPGEPGSLCTLSFTARPIWRSELEPVTTVST